MAATRTHLGDSHNFGRRVEQRGGRVVKPRALLWEWLVLAGDSPLRRLLEEAAARDGFVGPDAFAFLPSLAFQTPTHPRLGGEVEAVKLARLEVASIEERRALAETVGRMIALFGWLGVSDLHWENLVLGRNGRGDVVFAPLDVEMILADLSLPTETKLLPDADPEVAAICRHACGVRRVLPFLGKPIDPDDVVAMAGAYLATLGLLDRHAPEIADVFSRLPGLCETPIRVCLRGTDEYVRARTRPVWPPLLDAEAEQLARGDIPYFFRLYGARGIRYYADPSLERVAQLPTKGDVPHLDPMLSLSRDLRSPSRRKLREEGLLTVVGAFDHPSFKGVHASDALEVGFRGRTLVLRFADGGELESRRDLRAFVGSVYLPCTCGEVRSVFVPRATICDAAPPA
ncbi:MAG TPA: hypothetical protein VHB21_08095 [Minicystis sp.]|nr:hypothetical protein [Minicystis sp.]